jgi:hypothetical protein
VGRDALSVDRYRIFWSGVWNGAADIDQEVLRYSVANPLHGLL